MSRYSKYIAGVLSLAIGGAAHAQATVDQVVTFEVQSINQISVAGGGATLTITTAVAGSQPTHALASSSYSITTNEASRKITIAIDADMPHDVTLTATLAAPAIGASAGALVLSHIAQDAVTGIHTVIGSGLAIDYELNAGVLAGVLASDTRTVTLTIVVGP